MMNIYWFQIGMHDNIHKGFSNAMRSYDQVDGALMTIRIDTIQKDFKKETY